MSNSSARGTQGLVAPARTITIPGANYGLHVVPIYALLYEGVAELRQKGLELITAEQLALVQMNCPGYAHSPLNRKGSFVKEGGLYFKPKGGSPYVLVTRADKSPLLARIEGVAEAAKRHDEFHITAQEAAELSELARKEPDDARRSGVLKLPLDKLVLAQGNVCSSPRVPLDGLAENELTYFLLGKAAKPYGYWLKDQGVKDVSFTFFPLNLNIPAVRNYLDGQPFANQIRMSSTNMIRPYRHVELECLALPSLPGWVIGVKEVLTKQR